MECIQNLEESFERIDRKLLLNREINNQKFAILERDVRNFLQNANDSIAFQINNSRETILSYLMTHRDQILFESNWMVKLVFKQSLFKLESKIFDERINFSTDLTFLNKLTYLHLLIKRNEISDIELFDFKYLKTRVVYSQMISRNSILTLISLQGCDYLLRVHKINQSSFKTAREIILKSIIAYRSLQVKHLIYFLYTKQTFQTHIDIYDFDLNQIKSIHLNVVGSDMQIENFLSNKREIILDYGCDHWVYDLELKSIAVINSCCKNMKLINVSKEFLFYFETNETRNGKNLLVFNRINPNLFLKRIQLEFIKQNEWSYFTLVDYDSNILIKSLNGKEIYFVEFSNGPSTKCKQLISLNKIDLEKYGFDGIFQAENLKTSSNYNCLILFKNDGKRFKHVVII
jgi:hypothetical protein